jgi:hypothetical protein
MRVQENSLTAYLDELRDGLPLSREGACLLLRCPDDEVPALLAAALSSNSGSNRASSYLFAQSVYSDEPVPRLLRLPAHSAAIQAKPARTP